MNADEKAARAQHLFDALRMLVPPMYQGYLSSKWVPRDLILEALSIHLELAYTSGHLDGLQSAKALADQVFADK